MRVALLATIAILIAVGFLVYMTTYTVNFTDQAVVTTFGRASADSVVRDAGLHFKWPTPIQSTTVYDTRARLLQSRIEQQQTADNRQIALEVYMTWRVADPLVFFQRYRGTSGADPKDHYRRAEETLLSRLRSAMSEVSRYRMSDLFADDPASSRMDELEAAILERLKTPDSEGLTETQRDGVEFLMVGISRVVLPEDTTREVFARMQATQERKAAEAAAEGQAIASAIKSEGENAARKIIAFAQLRAAHIENQGDLEAAEWLKVQAEEPELARFLKTVAFIREGIGRQPTVILPTSMFGIELFGPNWLQKQAERMNIEERRSPPGEAVGAAGGEEGR